MRKLNVIWGDMVFQWKYGFYALYFLMIIIYLMLFSFFEGNTKNMIVDICVYSDPAAMGMFFMGALILLEKSQRVTNSIAISPVSTKEYILGKIVSIGLISEVVGLILIFQGKTDDWFLTAAGIFAGSVLFSLCGIIVGARIESLNQYIVRTVPFEIIGFVPVIFYRAGFLWDNKLMLLHPGCSIMQLICGNGQHMILALSSIILWLAVLFLIADKCIQKMFRNSKKVKL